MFTIKFKNVFKNNRSSIKNEQRPFTIISFIFLVTSLCVLIYFQLFTFYSPDTYVFVKYALTDNQNRQVDFFSLLSNNIIFDFLTVLGDKLNFTTGSDYLFLLTSVSALLFTVKYVYILRIGQMSDVLLVLIASFYALDLNQLRFNLALLLILYAFHGNKNRYFKILLSFFAHLMPFFFMLLKKLYYLPLILILIFPISQFQEISRVFDYISTREGKFFKSLLLIIPFIICYFERRKLSIFAGEIIRIGEPFVIIGVFMLQYDTAVTARLFETAFILCTLSNLFLPFGKIKKLILFFFAISIFISRSYSGISAGENDFVEDFILTPSDFIK